MAGRDPAQVVTAARAAIFRRKIIFGYFYREDDRALGAIAIVVKHEDADGRGKADVGLARLIHLDRQGVDGDIAGGGDVAEGLPELCLQ